MIAPKSRKRKQESAGTRRGRGLLPWEHYANLDICAVNVRREGVSARFLRLTGAFRGARNGLKVA